MKTSRTRWVFPLPGVTADETAPAFFGGSDLAVPAQGDSQGLAVEWIEILTSAEIQTQLVKIFSGSSSVDEATEEASTKVAEILNG